MIATNSWNRNRYLPKTYLAKKYLPIWNIAKRGYSTLKSRSPRMSRESTSFSTSSLQRYISLYKRCSILSRLELIYYSLTSIFLQTLFHYFVCLVSRWTCWWCPAPRSGLGCNQPFALHSASINFRSILFFVSKLKNDFHLILCLFFYFAHLETMISNSPAVVPVKRFERVPSKQSFKLS